MGDEAAQERVGTRSQRALKAKLRSPDFFQFALGSVEGS